MVQLSLVHLKGMHVMRLEFFGDFLHPRLMVLMTLLRIAFLISVRSLVIFHLLPLFHQHLLRLLLLYHLQQDHFQHCLTLILLLFHLRWHRLVQQHCKTYLSQLVAFPFKFLDRR